jgi:NADPH:quinone reductase-like Zn-dependent oxidoreductase
MHLQKNVIHHKRESTSMKAIICRQYGSPSLLRLEDIDRPEPATQELLVRVVASTVNRTDCAILSARPFIMRFFTGFLKPKNAILGTEFSGEVLAVGRDVKSFKPGERIFGFNDLGLKSHAEYLVIKETEAIATNPHRLSFKQAAASLEGAHYAYNYLNKVSVTEKSKILINGASGAIGSALLQFCVGLGAEVVVVCADKHKDNLMSLGAVRTIDYATHDFTQEDAQYDFVFDAVGKSSYFQCRKILDKKGIYISSELGMYGQNLYLPLVTKLSRKLKTTLFKEQSVIFPFPCPPRESLPFITSQIEAGRFTPVLDRSYTLDQIASAFGYVLQGQKLGNVVIEIVSVPIIPLP